MARPFWAAIHVISVVGLIGTALLGWLYIATLPDCILGGPPLSTLGTVAALLAAPAYLLFGGGSAPKGTRLFLLTSMFAWTFGLGLVGLPIALAGTAVLNPVDPQGWLARPITRVQQAGALCAVLLVVVIVLQLMRCCRTCGWWNTLECDPCFAFNAW